LVVIGIIALLIALLMPTLARAKQVAQRTSCAAKLQQIMLAAQIHVADHAGYYPLAGTLPGFDQPHLDDPNGHKYDYFGYSDPPFPASLMPITMSLGLEMSYRAIQNIQSDDQCGTMETDDHGFIRQFLCPSQANSVTELTQTPMLYAGTFQTPISPWEAEQYTSIYWEAQSYIFNEAILGWDDSVSRLKGKASLVKQSSKTMFAADGLQGSNYNPRYGSVQLGFGMATLYNISQYPPVTMADAWTSSGLSTDKAGDNENFDIRRHQGKINVAFCDGHVESRNITSSDLASIFILAP
jgi:prepilin-type processing-associated H-X9-DG protein